MFTIKIASTLIATGLVMPATANAAADVVAAARSQIGKPYEWGATGPDAYDCSGLVVWSYHQIGITIPRTSQEEAVNGTPVAPSDLQPGDVITFYPGATHVGIYTGDGMIIHASTYGHPVAEVPLANAGPFHNARRYLRRDLTVTDTLFADVSEYQTVVNDAYPYDVLSIRVSDGTYQDHNFAANYAWMKTALDSGRLKFGIIYTYVRPLTWQSNATTVKWMIDQNGGLHPRVALMLDVESGGNPRGDQSNPINSLHDALAEYAGDPARIIGYANGYDLNNMWPTRPVGVRLIGAGYPTDPNLPGQVAHQYTDGTGYGSPLPQGCAPFGNCDMNSADGLNSDQFAAACGIGGLPAPVPGPGPLGPLTNDEQHQMLDAVLNIQTQLGPWPQLGQNDAGQDLTLVDAVAELKKRLSS